MTKLGFLSLGAGDIAQEDHSLKAMVQKAAAAAQGQSAQHHSQHPGHSAHNSQAWEQAIAAERSATPARPGAGNPYIAQDSYESYDRSGAAEQDVNVNVVGRGLQVIGDIASTGGVTVHGLVKGDVECDQLTIGTGGRVEGDIRADLVQVHGSVSGAIAARGVKLFATSEVSADITHYSIGIELGADFTGALVRADKTAGASREVAAEQRKDAAKKLAEPQPQM